jgi:cytochrome oxidase Cu insertion factor (SCO1/SenC/PrrC family)
MRLRLRRILGAGLLACALAGGTATPLVAQDKKKAEAAPNMPKVGDVAPDFALKYSDGNDLKEVKLSDYRGKKNVVLAFYVFAFTGG